MGVGDMLIFSASTALRGIANTVAARASKDGTAFSFVGMQANTQLIGGVFNILMPAVARWLCDAFGRNGYASVQLIFILLNTWSFYKLCSAIRKHSGRPNDTNAASSAS